MKTTKNNIFTLLVGSLLTLGLYSCTDKYLDEEENYLIDSESYFNSEEDYYMALVGAYERFHNGFKFLDKNCLY